ncbi:hypothetical protein [Bacteroides heparinolyticus]|nr:hypothetical protein [Bacteroides heparinolyticus]MCF0256253.1 hypothetical protein [Bacteroides heparinolyticus]MCI6214056.1 hypothetical protein [Bacteroides heparinolyticus]
MMKKLLYLFMLLLCCACEENTSVDPTLMPEATKTGKNTLGCLIDGWIYTGGRFGLPKATIISDEKASYYLIRTQVDRFKTLEFKLVNPTANAECTYIDAIFEGENLGNGKAFITRKDGIVISGTFSGNKITEGRFDIKYTEKNTEEDIAY